MKIQLFSYLLAGFCLFSQAGYAFDPFPLRSPYPVFSNISPAPTTDKKCQKTPPAIYDMVYQSIYSDKSHGVSIVDEKARKKYKEQTKKIRDFENKIATWTEKSIVGSNDLPCAIKWMTDWADAKSMLEGKINFQGESVRKWTLGSLSSHYIQIRHSKQISKTDRNKIDQWLQELSDQVVSDYSRRLDAGSRRNNHAYWAAWGVMITSVTLNDKKNFKWSTKIFDRAMQDIDEDGTLPLEIARQGKAFNYHVFALNPLIMMAETLDANGKNGYQPALHRLVKRVTDSLEDQKYFKEKTGVKQNITGTITDSQLAWIEIYNARFPNESSQKWIDKFRPFYQRRIGGDITRLFVKNYSEEE